MSVWKKLFTAVKGGVNDAAENVADGQALRILDQEIREAREELKRSDHALTQIIAKRKLSEQKIASLTSSSAEYEAHAKAANSKGDQTLALDCARKVAELRTQVEAEQQYLEQFANSESSLRSNIRQAKDNLRRMEQQVDIVKATESVQKAQTAVSSSHLGANSRMKTATESLDRIQKRQQQRQAELEAASELASEASGDDLEKRLAEAGIKGGKTSADEELARILGS
ncbi:PspA/IM30 family protein [Halomonas binhaiensis]|uniref:PspA/IM30 family protein n=1 Tax=Halomonas binhaiensis TaxID=2562282 RepID=A0A5C1NF91_9GAMM|nr:PspA/IM30 family protein [Halomonas binhaiensis]QEM81540.1 PspA/IM30 family protein [Halomonas binhaiensis]